MREEATIATSPSLTMVPSVARIMVSLAPEMMDWLEFADEIFKLIRNNGLPEVWICPEIGPVRGGYGLSAFPLSWQQAIALHTLLKQRWTKKIMNPDKPATTGIYFKPSKLYHRLDNLTEIL